MDQVERIIRDATAKSKDGRITAADFLNEAAHSLRYGIFTPMEANIIWHFASRGSGDSSMRLANVDFDALLDPKVSGDLRFHFSGARSPIQCLLAPTFTPVDFASTKDLNRLHPNC
jgi:hypothetical protein